MASDLIIPTHDPSEDYRHTVNSLSSWRGRPSAPLPAPRKSAPTPRRSCRSWGYGEDEIAKLLAEGVLRPRKAW